MKDKTTPKKRPVVVMYYGRGRTSTHTVPQGNPEHWAQRAMRIFNAQSYYINQN